MIDIVELLSLRGLDVSRKTKLVRHKDARFDIDELIEDGLFEVYQGYQSGNIFDCDYVVSFIGLGGAKALFYGVYQVKDKKLAQDCPPPKEFTGYFSGPNYNFYTLVEQPGFEDYKGRVVIDWGRSALAWHQWLRPKEVLEVRARESVGYHSFPGFENLVLSRQRFVGMINHANEYRDWHLMLASVAGIYLITDTITGNQYVGSACGEKGIFGRWKTYASDPTGQNKKIIQLLQDYPGREEHFQYSILQTMPLNITPEDILDAESLFKKKLGSRANGLNLN